MFNRKKRLHYIKTLDPIKDHKEIVRLIAYYEFPWDGVRSLEFALFRTFASPRIGKLLNATGEFTQRTQKRYDDTDLILSEILEYGYDSDRGKMMIEKMNMLHGKFNISNTDMLYVLSTFVMEPWRWIEKFGWRKLCEVEKQALFHTWIEIGKRMGIKNLSTSFNEMETMNIEYEKTNFKYSRESKKVAIATENMFLGWLLPKWLWGLGRPFVRGFMDEHLLTSFKYANPHPSFKALLMGIMRLRSFFLSATPARRTPQYRTKRKNILSYPKGYTPHQLGPNPTNNKYQNKKKL